MRADLKNLFQVLELTGSLWWSRSGSRTDSDFLAVLGPVLMDFCPRVRFLGTWTDPSTKLVCSMSQLEAHQEVATVTVVTYTLCECETKIGWDHVLSKVQELVFLVILLSPKYCL